MFHFGTTISSSVPPDKQAGILFRQFSHRFADFDNTHHSDLQVRARVRARGRRGF